MKKTILYLLLFLTVIPGFLLANTSRVFAEQSPFSAAGNPNASLNWSGYAATGSLITSVMGSWVIPSVSNPSASLASDATWVGIGGVSGSDLLQIGTQAITGSNGQMVYQAWIESLPSSLRPLSLAVHPGDSISAVITNQSGNQWLVSLTDNTTGQNYQTTVQYSSSESSAEWIEEMPILDSTRSFIPLDNFGTINFSNCSIVENGQTFNLLQAGADPITMETGNNQVLAGVSSLGIDGASFSVTRSNAAVSPIAVRQPNVARTRTLRVAVGVQGFNPTSKNTRPARSIVFHWQSFFKMGGRVRL